MSMKEKIRKEIYNYMIQQMGFPQDPMETAKLSQIADEVINIVISYMREDEKNVQIVEKVIEVPIEIDIWLEKFMELCERYQAICIDSFAEVCMSCPKNEKCEHSKKVQVVVT